MKVPPDVRHLKTASVILTKLVPADLPEGITCNLRHSAHVTPAATVSTASEDSSDVDISTQNATSAGNVAPLDREDATESVTSMQMNTPEGGNHVPRSTTDIKFDDVTSSMNIRSSNIESKLEAQKCEYEPASETYCAYGDPSSPSNSGEYICSPSKRRKINFHTTPRQKKVTIQSNDGLREQESLRSNAMRHLSNTHDHDRSENMLEDVSQAGRGNVDSVQWRDLSDLGPAADNIFSGRQPRSNVDPKNTDKISDIDLYENISTFISSILDSPCAGIDVNDVGNKTCNANEQISNSKAHVTYKQDGSDRMFNNCNVDGSSSSNMPKSIKNSTTKLEKITAKLMREKQEEFNMVSTFLNSSSSDSCSPYAPRGTQEASTSSMEYTSIVDIDKSTSSEARDHRARKKTTPPQYFRAGSSGLNVSVKNTIQPQCRSLSFPRCSENKLKKTRSLLTSAISASTACTRTEYPTLEDWLEGGQRNVPNILVKSKFVPKLKETERSSSATSSQSSVSDQDKDAMQTASDELQRLKKVSTVSKHGNMTKHKQKRSRQSESAFEGKRPIPGPSRLLAVLGEGLTSKQSAPQPLTPTTETDRPSPKTNWLTGALHIKNPHAFPYIKEFELPVEGIQMNINKVSQEKGKTIIHKCEPDNSRSFQVIKKKSTNPSDNATPSTLSHADNALVKMGSFAISKSQEIIPINPNAPFPIPSPSVTKPKVTPHQRPSHAITYADYCAQMDNAESSKESDKRTNRTPESAKAGGSQRPKCDKNNDLQNDASVVLKKLTHLHVDNESHTDVKETTTTASIVQSPSTNTDTVNSPGCSGLVVKQEPDETCVVNVDEDDDDTDSVHLSDHRYTKTPDASPIKTLSTKTFSHSILHKTSTMTGAVSVGDRKKTPVYAVKYGNKLFLIPGNVDNNKKKTETTKCQENSKQGASGLQLLSPKPRELNVKEKIDVFKTNSPYATKKKVSRKVCTGKLVSKRKLEYVRQLILTQRSARRKRHQVNMASSYSYRSDRGAVERNAKIVYMIHTNGRLQTTTSRVGITLRKGADAGLKRWSMYGDFRARVTYGKDCTTLKHIEVDEIQSGFYKLTPASEMSTVGTITTTLTCVPPHPDAMTEGDTFLAVGPLHHVVDLGKGGNQIEEWSPCQIGYKLASIIPATALCHGNLHTSDSSYLPKLDAREWYAAEVFDIFTRKYCRQKRVVQRHKWDKNPYVRTFN